MTGPQQPNATTWPNSCAIPLAENLVQGVEGPRLILGSLKAATGRQ
jgi:hypothetical protein